MYENVNMRYAPKGPVAVAVQKSDRRQFSEPDCIAILALWRLSKLAARKAGIELGEIGARARLPLLGRSGSRASRYLTVIQLWRIACSNLT